MEARAVKVNTACSPAVEQAVLPVGSLRAQVGPTEDAFSGSHLGSGGIALARIPGVGRQQPVPVRGGGNREQRRYFLRGSFLGAGECGTRAGETAGEHQQNQSSTEPCLDDPCAVHSSRGTAQHSCEI
ncbi:hypothetical protein F7725_020743 [Dissostichus mawsoni]|uniref:Uncharacterized protein n=1 Tax=Dissostichus mawsoni TaxID=36200 RepID=A0A7J5YE44_DISMA|nr:hypothetical protein F7725_020743 [Dissostichus mawsoni]